jgi:hypothetical protein
MHVSAYVVYATFNRRRLTADRLTATV